MNQKSVKDCVLVVVGLALMGYAAIIAAPVRAEATLECCGIAAGNCAAPDQWCKQGPCAGPVVAYGYCVTHADPGR